MADITFDISPSYTTNRTITPRIKKVQLGDGYVQRGADGINIIVQKFSMQFVNITNAAGDTIDSLFKQAAGGTLLWKPPSATIGTDPYLKWMVVDWQRTWTDADNCSITATVEQVFE